MTLSYGYYLPHLYFGENYGWADSPRIRNAGAKWTTPGIRYFSKIKYTHFFHESLGHNRHGRNHKVILVELSIKMCSPFFLRLACILRLFIPCSRIIPPWAQKPYSQRSYNPGSDTRQFCKRSYEHCLTNPPHSNPKPQQTFIQGHQRNFQYFPIDISPKISVKTIQLKKGLTIGSSNKHFVVSRLAPLSPHRSLKTKRDLKSKKKKNNK